MHSLLSLAVGYNEVITQGGCLCNNVVAILAEDRLPRCSEARCRTPASTMPLAALFGCPSLARPSHCAPEALRCVVGGATMPIPGGAGTYPMRKRSFLRARRTGFYQGSELSRYGTPALRFAPPRCPKPY